MRFFCVPQECHNNKTSNNKALRIHCNRGQTPQMFLLPIDSKKTLCSPISTKSLWNYRCWYIGKVI